ncbi:MAG: hypothetical protein NC040_06550 [Muribaculaceae bacterium]|nr:hypothetical protein [Alistipes senegalensis]MCM1473699.1 hypothetical protein [Muribaculaceae bacterium]
MKRIVISCIIALLLCGCSENPKNTNDEKSDITSHSKDSRETVSEAAVTENTTTENTVTEKITSKVKENKTETVSTTVSEKEALDDKEFVITEKIEKNSKAPTAVNEDISTNTTESTVADTTQESEEPIVSETKPEVIELPFVPVG